MSIPDGAPGNPCAGAGRGCSTPAQRGLRRDSWRRGMAIAESRAMNIFIPAADAAVATLAPHERLCLTAPPDAIALGVQGRHWVLLNATQALLDSLPAADARAIAAVVLLDAQPAHVAGLLTRHAPLDLYATPAVFEELTAAVSPLAGIETPCALRWHLLPVAGDERSAEFRIDAAAPLRFRAIDAGGRAAPYSPHRREAVVGEHIAVQVDDPAHDRHLFFCPDAVRHAPAERGLETAP